MPYAVPGAGAQSGPVYLAGRLRPVEMEGVEVGVAVVIVFVLGAFQAADDDVVSGVNSTSTPTLKR